MIRWMTLLATGFLLVPMLVGCGTRKDISVDSEAKQNDGLAKKDDRKKDPEPPKDPVKTDAGSKVVKPDDKSKKPDPVKPKPKHTPPEPLKPTGEVVKLTSTQFGEEFKTDAATTTRKYHKKFVELTGKVVGVNITALGEAQVSLEGAKGADENVQCLTRDKKPWLSVLPGQVVTIRGIGPEEAIVPSLVQCDILGQPKGFVPPTRTATALAAEFAENPDAMKSAYKTEKEGVMKPIIVKGTIAKVEVDPDTDIPLLMLKTTKPTPVVYLRCTVGLDQKRAAKLKEGTEVTALGAFSTGFAGKQSVGISDVLIMEPAP